MNDEPEPRKRIRVIDTETTGLPEEPGTEVVEVAFCDLLATPAGWGRGEMWSSLCKPTGFIPFVAMAVHHITDDDVKEALPINQLTGYFDPGPDVVLAAFNAKFDRFFLEPVLPGRRWICAYKVALKLWPDAPRHSNQVLRYYLGLKLDKKLAEPPHRAPADSYVTACLLRLALKRMSMEEMLRISAQPALLPRVHFGKHQGERWEDVPPDYMRWYLGLADKDEDVAFTCEFWLAQRADRRARDSGEVRTAPPVGPAAAPPPTPGNCRGPGGGG